MSFLSLLLFIGWSAPLLAADPPDNVGREYMLTFMENLQYDPNTTFPLEIYISTPGQTVATVSVTSPKWSNPKVDQKVSVRPGEVKKVDIDVAFRMIGSSKSSKGLLVKSDQDIVVYGGNKDTFSNDVYCALPTDAVGSDYFAVCYGPPLEKTEIGVVGIQDGTTVSITLPKRDPSLTVDYDGNTYKAGETIKTSLDRYDTLQIQSKGDLTGTHIVCDKPTTVLSGNVKTNINGGPDKTSDHLVEQMTPVDTWGKKFVTTPIPGRKNGDIFRIVASKDNTHVNINGMPSQTLSKAGDFVEVRIPSDQYKLITADNGIMVTQFVETAYDKQNDLSDPSMMIIPPYELFGSKYTFTTPEYSRPGYGKYDNEFLVVVNDTDRDGLLLDGKPLPKSTRWTRIPGTRLVGTHIPITDGSHTVRHIDPTSIFGGYLYGHGYIESYAFPTGMRLAKINAPCNKTTQIEGDGQDNDCDGKIDEEICGNNIDDDNDGSMDEDCAKPLPVDGLWSSWTPWTSCSVTCGDGVQFRNRSCDSPAPKYGGKKCPGNETESTSCYSGKPCAVDIDNICKKNKTAVVANPLHCGQYYDCKVAKSSLGKPYLVECHYPQMFSTVTSKCEDFKTVSCGKRVEKQTPCEYLQNHCNGSDPSCPPCKDRLPNCTDPTQKDGKNLFPGRPFSPDYIVCDQNRTTDVNKCKIGYFDPKTRTCQNYTLPSINFVCSRNPTAKLQYPNNCAKYYDCTKKGAKLKDRVSECKYPDLFSDKTGKCENFTTVKCDTRPEPQAPCEYDQNKCSQSDPSCVPCDKRLPSCVSQQDGDAPVQWKLWKPEYTQCLLNRTMARWIKNCTQGYFHPKLLKCMKDVPKVDVPDFCQANPKSMLPDPDNCAHFYNCSEKTSSLGTPYKHECQYPDLFSTTTRKCENFTTVQCDKRKEPMAPCEYDQNKCTPSDPSCVPCDKRLPSCVSQQDGDAPVQWKLWKPEYTQCLLNRTMARWIKNCTQGYFHPKLLKCMKDVPKVDVPDFCQANPKSMLPDPDNCAHYYNCSEKTSSLGTPYKHECQYPDLFSTTTRKCENFTTVQCDKRKEPMAPCEYDQNKCSPSDPSCVPCDKRLPSCVSQQDGDAPVQWKLWKPEYTQCLLNRTMARWIKNCTQGYFHPKLLKCMKDVPKVDVPDFCQANPKSMLPDPNNCAHFYNCSEKTSSLGTPYKHECQYPDLFSTTTRKCENFTTVQCDKRKEPMAPCEYDQNKCSPSDPSCVPCDKRLPSCVSQQDGDAPVQWKLWKPEYTQCLLNRTMARWIKNCTQGYFHPKLLKCMKDVPKVDVPDFCQANPKSMLPDPDNCAHFYNCSEKTSSLGTPYKHECQYPDLFSTTTQKCENFTTVQCDKRKEPMAPCEYQQNLCKSGNTSCVPCDQRLPSCVTLPDGKNAIQWKLWKQDYAVCYKNRTMDMDKCKTRFFHPTQRKCMDKVTPTNIDNICKGNPKAILRNPDNCAQYFNCSESNSRYGGHLEECQYPDLFSTVTMKCENFTAVSCTNRSEPMAPCEYMQHLCNMSSDPSCVPCDKRLPSCVSQQDRDAPVQWKLWKPEYTQCLLNRTMARWIKNCTQGYFHPRLLKCMKDVPKVDVPDFCQANPKAMLPDPDNCAHFYNCSEKISVLGAYKHECKYPDLFSPKTGRCEEFTTVKCDKRKEPMAPCQYDQNLCNVTSKPNCEPCPKRLPSCIGKGNGTRPFPGRLWLKDYVDCYLNRTMNITKCGDKEYFNPRLNKCMVNVEPIDVPDYCQAHPTDILPDPNNCAHFFNCSERTTSKIKRAANSNGDPGNYRKECKYPQLYDLITKKCEDFENATCKTRPEPMAPCEYQQNLCTFNTSGCLVCPKRLPSCVGKKDGLQPFPGKEWLADHIRCYKNRTLDVTKCPTGEYFNPRLHKCMKDVPTVDIPNYCPVHPNVTLPDPTNCAKFYNCSDMGGAHGECRYPDLFSRQLQACQRFLSVSCDNRTEPQAPCEYDQNLCNGTDPSCSPCPKRLPSCRGLPDGDQPVRGELYSARYVTCLVNRTMAVNKCPPGEVFDPVQLQCINNIPQNKTDDFCKANQRAIKPNPNNCAQYINCSAATTRLGHHMMECKYPDLFDAKTLTCGNFTNVKCDKRREPQAPCEYQQNLCNKSDTSCLPCPKRLPSCIGHPDGDNPFPNHLWHAPYIQCFRNRTMDIQNCTKGLYFHPRKLICMKDVDPVDVPDYCKANPRKVLPDPNNCARLYNCSAVPSPGHTRISTPLHLGKYGFECPYPDLYDTTLQQCNNFTKVKCDKRTEPMAPCEYGQNLCNPNDKACAPCPTRLPSCIGSPEGTNPFPAREWKADYIDCYKNRTMEVTKCPQGLYYHPRERKCKKVVDPVDVPDYCHANPNDLLPDPDNCAHYFNCSDPTVAMVTRAVFNRTGNFRKECKYPDLFDAMLHVCSNFTSVKCENRTEPQAPCEYQQNLCPANQPNCMICPSRLPSCRGKLDGMNTFPTKEWLRDFTVCYKNRTISIDKCPQDEYFNPRLKKCMTRVDPVDVPGYCSVHTNATIPDPDNCAKFYNCSDMGGKHTECKYPDLFLPLSGQCEMFMSVPCNTRTEPQAPCEYDQNLCNKSDATCAPCPDRLPSCRGLPDGDQPAVGFLWTDRYVNCLQNRTMAVRKCRKGAIFDPTLLQCVDKISKGNIDEYCKANPRAIKPHPSNCGQYYNCSAITRYGHHLMECKYPDLFDEATLTCRNFTTVTCNDTKHEPQAPCEYQQNLCNNTDPSCPPCPSRLPSCVGLPDGLNPFPNKLWYAPYIRCFKNRTMEITKCTKGYFNPRLRKCMEPVEKVDIPDYCMAHPSAILPDPDNCAKYYNCSKAMSVPRSFRASAVVVGKYGYECPYPELFDIMLGQCSNFTQVRCTTRWEPMAPCQYDQNLCDSNNSTCTVCPDRLPSCIGKTDGQEPFPKRLWKPDYIQCFLNRTMDITKCKPGMYFNPRLGKCMKRVDPVDVPPYCKANPMAVLPDPDNCAHYFNCSDSNGPITRQSTTMNPGNYRKECHYPDLFDVNTKHCENFTTVKCDNRTEPQAPCEYMQNLCDKSNTTCKPCPQRLPNCRGLADGKQPFPTKLWTENYVDCYINRTMNLHKCPKGQYFNPRLGMCKEDVPPVDVPDYCTAHPTAVLPDPNNCAKFYNCSDTHGKHGECTYPDLFSKELGACQRFLNVTCKKRTEPQAPCEYDQNLCTQNDPSCSPCPERLPSCRGLPDGDQPIRGKLWTAGYVTCLVNRTMAVRKCPAKQVFDPAQRQCIDKIPQGNIDEFCKSNPRAIKPSPSNCAQYYNCSARSTFGSFVHECKYPDLFDAKLLLCRVFTNVTCDKKHEPQAPCEYQQNLCNNSDPNCAPCPTRLPTCVGHPDGLNPYPNKLWSKAYMRCYLNRTMDLVNCSKGYFNPRLLKCMDNVPKVDVPEYCKAHPRAILPNPANCGHYYNCSVAMATLPPPMTSRAFRSTMELHEMECKYPDLYDPTLKRCSNFTSVDCKSRPEPMAPCEYNQNLCKPNDLLCQPCDVRLPTCVNKTDGSNEFPSRLWKPDYVRCYKNRTMEFKKCQKGYFHPTKKMCTEVVERIDVPDFCHANPKALLPDPDNCAHFFDCSSNLTSSRPPIQRAGRQVNVDGFRKECVYPDLFDRNTLQCTDFTTVKCENRPEPQAPCEYQQNLCTPGNKSCEVCPRRLPSCIGKSDGLHEFPTRMWLRDYVRCYKNRTIQIDKCPQRQYFNPRLDKCTDEVMPVDVPGYCPVHTRAVIKDPDNCAKYFNCSDRNGTHTECHYPDLFSAVTLRCERFISTQCDNRTEPQAPCEYDQNLCPANDPSCAPCPERLPSCRGLPDGDQPVRNDLWSDRYVTCLINRTMAVNKCPAGAVFDPTMLQCRMTVPQQSIDEFCKSNPKTIRAHPTNCAQYYNCSSKSKYGNHLFECKYPDLFDSTLLRCRNFTSVRCEKKQEPMAPCDYIQNQCMLSDKSCVPCPQRLPSCVGFPDGNNPYPGKIWLTPYITCYRNRTVGNGTCPQGQYFHPRKLVCMTPVAPVDVPDYCQAHPKAILPDPYNCGQYFNCSSVTKVTFRASPPKSLGMYRMECTYPDLYNGMTQQCDNFENVKCDKRPEPQAPCEYEQNLCKSTDTNCSLCPLRLPSCRGKNDGPNPFPGKLWLDDYIMCYKNRTLNITKCPKGKYFNPRTMKCQTEVVKVDVPSYCTVHRDAVLPDPENCGKYFNCSDYGGAHVECLYPDLYSPDLHRCANFTSVKCDKRPEPQAPCEYDQNACPSGDAQCPPCPERLPSCVGKPDGLQTFPGREWLPYYIRCYKNRTVEIGQCIDSYFHPVERDCKVDVQKVDVPDYCQANPQDIVPDLENCAHFYNCSDVIRMKRVASMECTYPDLFSRVTLRCERFTTVTCDKRTEPQAPCQYEQNLCSKGNNSCAPCPERLPSCIGNPEGRNLFPGLEWTANYITCYKNRTIDVQQCPKGEYFHPTQRACKVVVNKVDIPPYCKANPSAVIQSEDNCAQYYNCSYRSATDRSYLQECTYPDLYSPITHRCENFQTVSCRNRPEPQAPCQYKQNLCSTSDPSCPPCPERLPSCIGLPDGVQSFPGQLWTVNYILCLLNRTIEVKQCPKGSVFDPTKLQCVDKIAQNSIPGFCRANPNARKPHPTNCAQYVDCTKKSSPYGAYISECRYPDLFSAVTLRCENFTTVNCIPKNEPQAPCEYYQNLCPTSDPTCRPCPERLPSCVGLPDGRNPHPRRLWQTDYIMCFRNRTVGSGNCSEGFYFHPRELVCKKPVDPVDVPDYCTAHPRAILRDPRNCAHYFNCSDSATLGGRYTECRYPDLFSEQTMRCQGFTTVQCQDRKEPQAPCQYDQNLCQSGDKNCDICPLRLPSCIGKSDGNHSFIGRLWESYYITCYKNRTIKIDRCPNGYFHPNKEKCETKLGNDGAPDYCKTHPGAIYPSGENCAQYYNCSKKAKRSASSHIEECKYPDLFSRTTMRCEHFQSVACDSRPEPQAPCEYKQNLCPKNDPTCAPCPERLPSCVGLRDGAHPFPTKLWTQEYIYCEMNRTTDYRRCQKGWVFDPYGRQCVKYIPKPYVEEYCKLFPRAILPSIDSCAQYINCSLTIGRFGAHIKECTYPDLFDQYTLTCRSFTEVKCDGRPEPSGPCEYEGNLCSVGDTSCTPCPERLPSCYGLPNGFNADPRSLWSVAYIKCFNNRTVAVQNCQQGFFNARTRTCTIFVNTVDVLQYCKYHPTDVLPDPTNCARYYNCSRPKTVLECTYPDLYSMSTKSCVQFSSTYCDNRPVPLAPCEYSQNLCRPSDSDCKPCPERLPSCVGLSDGNHVFPGQTWSRSYFVCLHNRTVDVKECPANTVFDPKTLACTTDIPDNNIDLFCRINPKAVKPHPMNCAQYYNCSAPTSTYGKYIQECRYPALFSPVTLRCQEFSTVSCGVKHEPMAPCEYRQNLCPSGAQCKPCPERYPSCIGLSDGNQVYPGRLWHADYIRCYRNRTVEITKCRQGLFNPRTRTCIVISQITGVDIPLYCKAYPKAVIPSSQNCAQFYNCSRSGGYTDECPYPMLYSTVTQRCQNFTDVICAQRPEPQAPCQYIQNQCLPGSVNCRPCPERLYSCVGLPNGLNAVPGHRWSKDYILCYRNRTILMDKCLKGAFHPVKRICDTTVNTNNIDAYCRANPRMIVVHPSNCAQFYNCSHVNSELGGYVEECPYPQLFSAINKACQNFTLTKCGTRYVPQAPCEYLKNLRAVSLSQSISCPELLPSCIGLPDGRNEFPGKRWWADYILCYHNRTLGQGKCERGYFDPYKRICVTQIPQGYIVEFCRSHPRAFLPNPSNCAQYYDCSGLKAATVRTRECTYPQLFSLTTMSCQPFDKVQCEARYLPQAPCQYSQNLCRDNTKSCTPCPERLPSCVGLPQGRQAFPGRSWTSYYIECDRNRTIVVSKCRYGIFDPVRKACVVNNYGGNIVEICRANPTWIIEDTTNCAQYYNCSKLLGDQISVTECIYPNLYSTKTKTCRDFRTVTCGTRPEPMAPCEYKMNLCAATDQHCLPCPIRLPSCVGLPNGLNAIPTQIWSTRYLQCLDNRTVGVESCPHGWFQPVQRQCVTMIHPGDILRFCQYNKKAVAPDLLNAAHFFNCSSPDPARTHYEYECPYPQLFSVKTLRCQDFRTVPKDIRPVPQAPCEYVQYQCQAGDPQCRPCEDVHHSCVGLPDGDNAVSGKTWTPLYVTCLWNRTMEEKKCKEGVFDPRLRICTRKVDTTDKIELYCRDHPTALLKHPGNCAWYYNCSQSTSSLGSYIAECRYPQLFSTITNRCEYFLDVRNCGQRHEPQAPCEYQKNLCPVSDPTCIPCPTRLPSCIGLPDQLNPIPGRYWDPHYLRCYRNRTEEILRCEVGYFHPEKMVCVDMIHPSKAVDFCRTNPTAIIRSTASCAQYIDCTHRPNLVVECRYPDLFSPDTLTCQKFTSVQCGTVPEPQAPCSYEQNLCKPSEPSCLPCPTRLPSCVGLPDGYNSIQGTSLTADYVQCYINRTMAVERCAVGYFDTKLKKCMEKFTGENIEPYCSAHPTARLPNYVNCAQYYDCSLKDSIYRPYLHECPYPQLFSTATLQCQSYREVTCGARTEPMAPCQYLQNQCAVGDTNCLPCPMRLPSCLDLPDGDNAYPGRQNSSDYVNCDRNRTLSTEQCREGWFDKATRRCVRPTPPTGLSGLCSSSRNGVVPDSTNCARFYNCSDQSKPVLQECPYPSLFSTVRYACEKFEFVQCGLRYIPQAPCEYSQNLCPAGDTTCERCPSRLPSCVGMSDGEHPFPGRLWTVYFIQCYKNRTVNIGRCRAGVFDPNRGDCVAEIGKAYIGEYCQYHPSVRVPFPYNCAQYYDCQRKSSGLGMYLHECPYPQLFDRNSLKCKDRIFVKCGARYAPNKPCEYELNKCTGPNCLPCETKFSWCTGLPDGANPYPGTDITNKYIECKSGLTVAERICPGKQIFSKTDRKCIPTQSGAVRNVCDLYPNIVRPDPFDCAHYIDCSKSRPGFPVTEYLKECEYPKLFSTDTMECEDFQKVHCNIRPEPRAPCEYVQNACPGDNSTCVPCVDRLPSCIGFPDGDNPVMESLWTSRYVKCYKNRTLEVRACPDGVFDPYERKCNKDTMTDFCIAHPDAALPNLDNCAQFYDCTVQQGEYGLYQRECEYPRLYNIETGKCEHFSKVNCGERYEPITPCEYIQNQCIGPFCKPCINTKPSCRGLPDGPNPYPGQGPQPRFIVCEHERTVAVDVCVDGIFDPETRVCINYKNADKVNAYCDRNPGAVLPSYANCAHFYECGAPNTLTGTYLHECVYPKLYDIKSGTCKNFTDVWCGERKEPQAPCDYMQYQCRPGEAVCLPCEVRKASCVGLPNGKNPHPDKSKIRSYVLCYRNRTIDIEDCREGMYFEPYIRQCIPLRFYGAIPFISGQDVCNQQLVSGPNGVPDTAFSASSVYNKGTSKDYSVARARINTTESKDAQGNLHIGAWSAKDLNVDQYIQVELKDPTLIRGIMTQGRDGCCKQWVTKYRVLYSMDCSNNSNSWHALSGHNVSDVFFKGNSDENTIESHDFDCPVIAKCIRINPLEWHNHISMRFDLLGCHLDTGNGSSSNNNNSNAATTSGQTGGMTMVSTTSQMTTGSGGGSTTAGVAGGSTMPQTTGSGSGQTTGGGSAQPLAGQTTGSGSGQTTGGATTSGATTVSLTTPTTSASTSGAKPKNSNCITTTTGCTGKVDGDYPFCTDCTQYVTCANTILYMRPCPAGLHWNTALSVCDWPNNANCQASG